MQSSSQAPQLPFLKLVFSKCASSLRRRRKEWEELKRPACPHLPTPSIKTHPIKNLRNPCKIQETWDLLLELSKSFYLSHSHSIKDEQKITVTAQENHGSSYKRRPWIRQAVFLVWPRILTDPGTQGNRMPWREAEGTTEKINFRRVIWFMH